MAFRTGAEPPYPIFDTQGQVTATSPVLIDMFERMKPMGPMAFRPLGVLPIGNPQTLPGDTAV